MGQNDRPKDPQDIVDWAVKKVTKPPQVKKPIGLDHQQVAAWQLLTCGYSSESVGAMLGVNPATIRKWKQKIVKEFAEMPSIRAAIDATMTMVPKALRVVDKALDGIDSKEKGYRPVAYQAAKDILTANRIFTDRIAMTDDRAKPDHELVVEAERIMAQAKKQLTDDIAVAVGNSDDD